MIRVALLFSLVLVTGCSSPRPTPRPDLNGLLRQSVNSRRDPSLGGRWLASLGQRNGRERVELIDLRNRSPVPLPGLNRADAQPISVSVSGDGQRLAVVQQREDRTELVLYRRKIGATQRLPLDPPGVPRSVSLDGSGRRLAVQVSRNGRWDVDLIRLP
ncbi:hypothetical protein Syncc8109_2352 [Synechococcus sp. WH 8109]|uniref:hypothetical protein n=1 Tax=Synechococcus sp. WH 8109 TaxID=166314 RepID=UPI0001B8E040|nr:hypothetical protein [Synechococcus sp. WH 8109]AHF64671.1 hypothetical protein Syncc8109_2352 [Synechococcus sp. WH 8109]